MSNILVVDDEPVLREVLVEELRFEGHQVWEATGGIEGLEIVRNNELDVVISDIRMPKGDGVELLKAIKNINPTKPIVFLITGFTDYQEKVLLDLGAEAVVRKPFSID